MQLVLQKSAYQNKAEELNTATKAVGSWKRSYEKKVEESATARADRDTIVGERNDHRQARSTLEWCLNEASQQRSRLEDKSSKTKLELRERLWLLQGQGCELQSLQQRLKDADDVAMIEVRALQDDVHDHALFATDALDALEFANLHAAACQQRLKDTEDSAMLEVREARHDLSKLAADTSTQMANLRSQIPPPRAMREYDSLRGREAQKWLGLYSAVSLTSTFFLSWTRTSRSKS